MLWICWEQPLPLFCFCLVKLLPVCQASAERYPLPGGDCLNNDATEMGTLHLRLLLEHPSDILLHTLYCSCHLFSVSCVGPYALWAQRLNCLPCELQYMAHGRCSINVCWMNKWMKTTVNGYSSTLVCILSIHTYWVRVKITTKTTAQLCLTITESKANELKNIGLNPQVKGKRDREKAVHISCVP